MTDPRDTIGRYVRRSTALGAVLLVVATATASAQPHSGGAGGSMGGWGAFSGWMFLWPVLLLGLLALLVVWAGSRRRGDHIDRTDRPDRALEELRGRYARGELSEDEFERLKALVEGEREPDEQEHDASDVKRRHRECRSVSGPPSGPVFGVSRT